MLVCSGPCVFHYTHLLKHTTDTTLFSSRYKESISLIPVAGRIFELRKKYNLSLKMFMKYPLKQHCCFHSIETRTSLAINKKNDMAKAIWRQLDAELHETKYGDRIALYTDGSVKD